MIQLAIDGRRVTGKYRVDCECGQHWTGDAERIGAVNFNPALPIAESIAHMHMCHPDQGIDIRFSELFVEWLKHYWERASLRQMAAGQPTNPAIGSRP